MVIAVNTRLLLKDKLEGIGWFTNESLKRITRNHPEHTFIFLFDRPFSEEFIFSDNIVPLVASPPTRHPVLWYYWLEFVLPKIFVKHKVDLFLSPDGFLSLASPVKQIPVIHDLNFEHFPQDVPFTPRNYYKRFFPLFANKAARIATVSEYSKHDIAKCYKINPEKIDVVYNGANEVFAPYQNNSLPKKITRPYFLFVGALNPRKNVSRLLQAFDEFKQATPSDVKLVIAGEKMWKTSNIKTSYDNMKHKADVVFTGRVGMDKLKDIMAGALALAFVPYFEGFGIPIVEALYSDVPVITSNVTSMPEVAGDAGLLVDPFSVSAIRNALLKLYKDDALRNELINKGRIQREKFSWDKTADGLWNCIEKTMI